MIQLSKDLYTISGKNECKIHFPRGDFSKVNHHMIEKINFLVHHPNVTGKIMGFPDLEDDEGGLNGFLFESDEVLFPIGAGFDIGCGFRLLHIPKENVNVEKLEQGFNVFHQQVTNPHPIKMTSLDISQLVDNPVRWAQRRELSSTYQDIVQSEFDGDRPSLLDIDRLCSEIGRIAPGNHFIEFRTASTIDVSLAKQLHVCEGDVFVFIHSGSGQYVKQIFMKYFAKMYAEQGLGPIRENFNGYQVFTSVDSDLGKNFLADAQRAQHIAFSTREIITHFVSEAAGGEVGVILDTPHSVISLLHGRVRHQHSVQTYKKYRGLELAIIAGSSKQDCILVEKAGLEDYVNHGVGSLGGDRLTNHSNPLDEKYYPIEKIIAHGVGVNWYLPMLRLHPWKTFKQRGN